MSLTILIAIADNAVAQRYERFLRLSGFDVTRVGSGTDCWDLLQQRRSDALILDEALPWGGGDGVLACLRDETNDLSIPVVLLSHSESCDFNTASRQLRTDAEFPVVARFPKSAWLPSILNALLSGLRDFPQAEFSDQELQLELV